MLGSLRNRDCILYSGVGTVVLIRSAQTFYERIKILSKPSVDWILMLHTCYGQGTTGELFYFAEHPEIVSKTTILFPEEFYDPPEGLTANTVVGFWAPQSQPVLYTDQQLASCNLVADCRNLAAERLFSKSSLSWSFRHLPFL